MVLGRVLSLASPFLADVSRRLLTDSDILGLGELNLLFLTVVHNIVQLQGFKLQIPIMNI